MCGCLYAARTLNNSMCGCLYAAAGEAPDYSSGRVRCSIKNSLERLGVDYIDVLHCHDIEFCPDMRQVRVRGLFAV